MSTRARTPENFPRMKVRGGTRRHGKRTYGWDEEKMRSAMEAFADLGRFFADAFGPMIEAITSIAESIKAISRAQERERMLAEIGPDEIVIYPNGTVVDPADLPRLADDGPEALPEAERTDALHNVLLDAGLVCAECGQHWAEGHSVSCTWFNKMDIG